jgi:exosortase K
MSSILASFATNFIFMKSKQVDIYSFFFMAAFALLFKVFYSYADNDNLQFILLPTNMVIEFFIHQKAVYSNESGFFYPNLKIAIDKYCAGLNFYLIALLASFLTLVVNCESTKRKIVLFLFLTIICFVLTIFANVARILSAICIFQLPFAWLKSNWLHEAQGTFIYLTILLSFYTLLIVLQKKYTFGN